jgi:DNA (cytosine-5)-methyltransferase 1
MIDAAEGRSKGSQSGGHKVAKRFAYYNENDPFAAEWLRNLVKARLIAPGIVDSRSIAEVMPEDVSDYAQCHFFAGIGLWSDALRRAGIDDSTPIWTGSCPCQPFSIAGKRKGLLDDRHLWPHFFRLIRECAPSKVFGEQVASPDGRKWLSGVFADLEGLGYACAGADLCAAGVTAPHIRQRLYWLGNAAFGGSRARNGEPEAEDRREVQAGRSSFFGQGLGNSRGQGLARRESVCGHYDAEFAAIERTGGACMPDWNGATTIVECEDGFRRIPVEPALFPLVNGDKTRMGRLRAYGNAIVPEVAAEFVKAALLASDGRA